MSKFKWTKAAALMLVLSMAASMTACSGDSTGNSSLPASTTTESKADGEQTDTPQERVDLIFLQGGAGIFEEENSATINKIAEETGVFVQMNVVADDKWNVMMASGSMEGDIISPNSGHQQQLIEGNLVIPLDDLVKNKAPNVIKNASQSLDYWREYKSVGKNQLFFIPSHNAPKLEEITNSVPYNYAVAPFVRWDYYEELGAPEVKNEDEFLNMLKAMQDKHPTNADGKKTYAMSLEVSSSPMWCYNTFYSYSNGNEMLNNLVARNSKFEIDNNALQENFITWRAAEYYNKAFRLGIYDPETFTQKGENVAQKITTSQSFYTENSWNDYNQVLGETVSPDAGFAHMIEAFPTAYAGGTGSFGWGFTSAITSSCKNPEAAMKWIDYLYSEEGARLLYSGIEGQHWNYDANKVPALTDETVKMYQDKEWTKVNGLRKYHNQIGIDNIVPHSDGYPVDLFQTPAMMVKNNKKVDENYSKKYGATYPGEVGKVLEEKGTTDVVWWVGDAGSLMPVMPDDLVRILTKADDAMIKGMPKLIMSKTKEDFDKEKASLIKQLDSLGVKNVIDWTTTEYNASKAKVGELTK